jgi:flagellar biosynthetic protein FliP
MKRSAIAVVVLALSIIPSAVLAQTLNLQELLPPGQGTASGRIIQLVTLLTVLSVAPGILVTVTCFTRLIVALSFLRSGLGLASTPSNLVMVSLALFMTGFVMAPTFDKMWVDGVQPLIENRIDEKEALQRMVKPLREFMQANVREKDLQMFDDMMKKKMPAPEGDPAANATDLRSLVPAFMVSELRRGFEIGFLILLPFLVIDLIVSTLVMSMGMMMLSPTTISLPFKVLFFVLIDGWNLLVGGLMRSFV